MRTDLDIDLSSDLEGVTAELDREWAELMRDLDRMLGLVPDEDVRRFDEALNLGV